MSRTADAPTGLLVTGAAGWVGSTLVAEARRRGLEVDPLEREALEAGPPAGRLRGRALVHLAAIAHRGGGSTPDAEYERVNHRLAVDLATRARDAGAPRFVFVSTAAVMGGHSARPWRETDPPAPADPYARAKWRAERALDGLRSPGRFDVRIVRPPLVWGPGVRANFLRLLQAAAGPWPLPLGCATAPRSMVHVDNLVDALLALALRPGGVGGTWFVRDGEDLSVARWITRLRAAMGRPPRLLAVPAAPLGLLASLAGRRATFERLFEPACVDDGALRATGWQPPVGIDEGIAGLLRWYAGRPSPP